ITDFDIIGLSYYPQWSTFSISDMGAHVTHLRQRFGKDVMVVETAYGWTREAADETADNILNQGMRGYPFTPEGQRRFMTDLTQALVSNGGLGVVYWEPAWVSTPCSTRWGQGSHWENATFFDFQNGNELLEGADFLSHAYWTPEQPVEGALDAAYGALLATDPEADGLDDLAGLDLTALHGTSAGDGLFLAAALRGDARQEGGSLLLYFDTTGDSAGADTDVRRRPITVADPFRPEFRLDISLSDQWGAASGSVAFYAWVEGDWQDATFTGTIAFPVGAPSVIEIGLPRALLGDPAAVNVAAISTDSSRAHTAGDIMGTAFTPSGWTEPVVLENFFSLLPEGAP
ncbi:MAG: glycosyl hydrolase 53 family protein, partial [Anaerolineae bacterium]|nr:glycosyl hydrolase 53 family protein [Anaerolineae bacterium]